MSIRFSSDVEARSEACMPAAFLLLVFFFCTRQQMTVQSDSVVWEMIVRCLR